MNQDEIGALLCALEEKQPLSPADVPRLSLYIDQILTLFATGAAPEQALTKAMVNNYSKERLLRPIQGKKYSREQLLQLLLICRLKRVLPIGEIKQITQTLMAQELDEDALEQILLQDDAQRGEARSLLHTYWQQGQKRFGQELDARQTTQLILELAELSSFFEDAARALARCTFEPQEQAGGRSR